LVVKLDVTSQNEYKNIFLNWGFCIRCAYVPHVA
jgi:hypothetical protein